MPTAPNAASSGTITIGGDMTVNRLGFGAMRITGEGIWGAPPDIDTAKATLRRVVDLGVTFIDTADSYGPEVSENLIRETLAPYPDNLVIATKGGLERPRPNEWVENSRPSHLRAACESSLRRLGLEQIPLYQWHRPDKEVPLEDAIGTLVELKNEGKIRHIGVSNVTVDQLRRAQQLTDVVSVQNRYNVGTRGSDDVLDVCEKEGLAFFPWAPMHDVSGADAVREVAQAHDATDRQVVLAWLMARSPVIVPIPGTGDPDHADANIAAAELSLTDDEVARLTASAAAA